MPNLQLHIQACYAQLRCRPDDSPKCAIPRARRRFKRPDIDWQSICTYSANVSCLLYLTSMETGKGLQNICFPSMVMLTCQTASAQSRQKKAVSHLDVLRVNLALSGQATTLSTSGCKDATIMSLLRALQATNRSSA